MKWIHVGWLALLFLLLFSCNKKEDTPEVEPVPEPEVEFEIPENDELIMYEVNLRAFSASGDLQGVIQGLDHIKSMGVNVIWLMPIHPIGDINSVNSPYSVKNYKEVSVEYGSLSDLKSLLEKAHDKNMAVILDWVANHTAWDNPWITNKDWYTQDANGNIISPEGTNWTDVADLNYDNHDMRMEMIEAMKYWIVNTDVDGFRCDAADMIPFDFWQEAIIAINDITDKDLIYLAEGARSDHFSAGFDLNFSWNYYNKLKDVFHGVSSPNILFTIHQQSYNNMPAGMHKLYFTTNHDESAWDATPMVIFDGKEGALSASAITIFLGGVPLIYNGQEVGVAENIPFFTNSPIDWALNPDMLDAYRKVLSFYSSSDVVKKGELSSYSHPSVAVFTRTTGTEKILVIANTRNENIILSVPDELAGKNWIDVISGAAVTTNTELNLASYEYQILKSN